ncbi:MAG: outer membrane beta-barrel protein [Deltaproteobacteria bacterium]|nr:outer membrane beta-barrel protein [Deltaproteobacteria bacterium]
MKLKRMPLFLLVLFLYNGGAFLGASSGASQWQSQLQTGEPYNKKSSTSKEHLKQISPFSPESNNLALDVGQVLLTGDYGRNYTDSIGYRLHYTYGVSDMFGFDASFGFSDHSDSSFSVMSLLTGLRTNLSWYDKIVPYVVFGLGFYKPSRIIAPGVTASPVEFGVHLGPGFDLELTKQLYFGAALTFHDIFGTVRQTVAGPMDFGGSFISFLLHIGTTF